MAYDSWIDRTRVFLLIDDWRLMKQELFALLLESVREGSAILGGERQPARTTRIDHPDVRALRKSYGLTQPKFAALMGISVATLRNWEQGRRRPEGSARILLLVVARNPEAVLMAVAAGQPAGLLNESAGRRAASRGR